MVSLKLIDGFKENNLKDSYLRMYKKMLYYKILYYCYYTFLMTDNHQLI